MKCRFPEKFLLLQMPKKRPALSEAKFFEKGHLYFIPQLSIDCVIFGFHQNQLKVLLLQWKSTLKWSLPGGFIYQDENIGDAAVRILSSRTGLRNIYLQQFQTFGQTDRDQQSHGLKSLRSNKKSWLKARFITIGYWAIVDFSEVKPTCDEFSVDCKWWDINKVPKLMLDHNLILSEALESLRRSLNDYPVGRNLLSEKFTMPELQSVYETILGKTLDRRNFQKKILSLDILQKLNERKTAVAHKAPFLYKFDEKKYQRAMKQGIKFGV
jgi:8-oxo-dGTP diphosphatase